jgi:cell division protein FtsB
MDIGRTIRRQLQYVLGPTIGLSLSAYFGYHLVEGDRGLVAWGRLTQQIHQETQLAASVHAERVEQQRRVSMLQPAHLDPDLLDEQARSALNLAGPDEVVLLNSQENQKK